MKLSRLLLLGLFAAFSARADVAVPANVLDPKTPAEAWNVIRLATTNIEKLLEEKRLGEVITQASFCSPALRALARDATSPERKMRLAILSVRGLQNVSALAQASSVGDHATTVHLFDDLRSTLHELAEQFDSRVTSAEIFLCPMHPDFIAEDPKTPCAKCGMALIPRRIPYSFVYVTPGQPSIVMTATADQPLEAGREAHVKVTLKRGDGSPVLHADLLVMHTQPIHLLIVDPSLGDYHHEHPAPTSTPGEYAFSFTPTMTAPYRIWADLVPAATSVQEYPSVDLPSAGQGSPVPNKADTFSSAGGGLQFALAVDHQNTAPLRAQEIRLLKITVTAADGQPERKLEPVMNAFAHLVGFYDDYRTVVHLHPAGGDVVRQDLRGGPSMEFRFFPPKAGFIRLYCQVLVEGKMIFAPFNVNVAQ